MALKSPIPAAGSIAADSSRPVTAGDPGTAGEENSGGMSFDISSGSLRAFEISSNTFLSRFISLLKNFSISSILAHLSS